MPDLNEINKILTEWDEVSARSNYINDSVKRVEKNLSPTTIRDINRIYGSTSSHLDFGSKENDRIAVRKQARAKAQSKLTQFGNSMLQGLWGEAIVGTTAGIWDLLYSNVQTIQAVNPLSDYNIWTTDKEQLKKTLEYRLQHTFDNTVANWLNEHQRYIREELAPIHRDEQTPLAFGEWGWYMENLPNAVSTLTLLLPAAGEAKLVGYVGKGARIAINVAKGVKATRGLSKGFGISRAAASALSKSSKWGAGKVLESAFGNTKLGNVIASGLSSVGSRPATVAKFLRGVEETGIQAFASRTLEGIQESREVYNDTKNNLIDMFSSMSAEQKAKFKENNTENGKYIFEGMTDEEIAGQIALESAKKTFVDDYQALVFDLAQFYALRRFLKPITNAPITRKVYNAQQRSLANLSGTEAVEKTWLQWQGYKIRNAFGSFKNFGKSAFTSAESASLFEMPEEMIQGINTEKGKEVAKHYLDPNYIDRTYENYLTDPKIWDQGVWGALGGMIFNYGGRALGYGYKKGTAAAKLKLGLLTEDAYNKLMTTSDMSRVKNIESRVDALEEYTQKMNLIEEGRNPYKRYINENGEQYFDEEGNAFEYAQESEREALKVKATEEYVTKLALNAYEAGNADLVMEYLKNKDFHKLLETKGLKFSDEERKAGQFIQDTVENIFENYEKNLLSVIENTDSNSDVINKLVARDLTLLQNKQANNDILLGEYTEAVNSDNYNISTPATAQQYVDNYRKRYAVNKLKQLINAKEFFRTWKDEGTISEERMAKIEEDAKAGKITSERLEIYRQIYNNQQIYDRLGNSTSLSVAGYNAYISDINNEIRYITNYLQERGLLNYREIYKNENAEEETEAYNYSLSDIGNITDFAYSKTFSEALNSLSEPVRKIFDVVTNDAMFGDVTKEFKRKVSDMVVAELDKEAYNSQTPITNEDYQKLYDKYSYTMDAYTRNLMGSYMARLNDYLYKSKTIEELEDRWNRILNGRVSEDLEDAVTALKVGYLNLLENDKGNPFSNIVNSAYQSRKSELLGIDKNKKEKKEVVVNQGTAERKNARTKPKENKQKETKSPVQDTAPVAETPQEEPDPIEKMPEDEGDGEIQLPEIKEEKKETKPPVKEEDEGYYGEAAYDAESAATSVIEEAVDDVLDENPELVKEAAADIDPNSEAFNKILKLAIKALENKGIPYSPGMKNIFVSWITSSLEFEAQNDNSEFDLSALGAAGLSKFIKLDDLSADERIEKFLNEYLKTIEEVNYNGKRVVNVYKLMQMLLNDKNVNFEIAVAIVKNLKDYITNNNKYVFIGINNEFTNNPRAYLRKLAQTKNEATIVNGLRINRPNNDSLSRMGYDTPEKREAYNRLRNKLLMDLNNPGAESNPELVIERNGKDSNSVRFVINYTDSKGESQTLEIGYVASPIRTNHNRTYSVNVINSGFNYSITSEGNGVYSANVDNFFNTVIYEESEEAKKLRQILRDYAFRVRERIKSGISQWRFVELDEDTAKELLENKLIKELLDKDLLHISEANQTKIKINDRTIEADVNKASRIAQILTDVLYKTDEDSADTWKSDDAAFDYILTATPDEVKESYEKWKFRVWDQYDRSYKVIEKFNANQKQKLSISMINQIVLRVNTSDALTDVNEVVQNNTNNKLVYMSEDGSILDENGNNLGVSSRVNELAILVDTGSYVQADGYEPPMVFINKKNRIGREGRLYRKVKEELTNIIKSQFSDKEKSPNYDEIKRKLNSLFGVKGLFSGYKVIEFNDKNGKRMLALSTTGQKSVNILTFYEDANSNGRTGIVYNPFGTKYNFIHSEDKELLVNGVKINAVDVIVSSLLDGNINGIPVSTGVLFNTSFAIVKQNSGNEYIERKDGALYVLGERYSSSLDFVMKEKAFATHAKKDKEGALLYGVPQFKTIYLNVDDIGQEREKEALKGINIKVPKPGETVNTLDFLKQLGFREEYVRELMGYSTSDGKISLPLIPEEFIFSADDKRLKSKSNPLLGDFEGIFEHSTGKIKVSALGALGSIFSQRESRGNLIRVLMHEQLHRALSAKGFAGRQRLFAKTTKGSKEIVDELLNIAQVAYDKITEDILNENNVGGLTTKTLIQIQKYLESVINKTGIYDGKDDFYVAEEFIVESLTRSALLRYFNNTTYGKVNISNIEESNKTIWQKLFDKLLEILNRLGYKIGSIKDNTILARQYEIFGQSFDKEVQDAEIKSSKKGTKQEEFEKVGKVIQQKEKELTDVFGGWHQGENKEDWEKNHSYVFIDENGVHYRIFNSVTKLTNMKSDGTREEYTGSEAAGPIGTEFDEYSRLYFDANAIDENNVVTDFENDGSLKYLDKMTDAQKEEMDNMMEEIRQNIINELGLRGKRFKIITSQTIVAGTVDVNDKGIFNGKKTIAGTIDMIILTEDGYYIIDFKTNIGFDGTKSGIERFINGHPQYGKQVDLYNKFIDANTDKLGKCLGKYLVVAGVAYDKNLKYDKDTKRLISDEDIPFSMTGNYAVIDVSEPRYGVKYDITSYNDSLFTSNAEDVVFEEEEIQEEPEKPAESSPVEGNAGEEEGNFGDVLDEEEYEDDDDVIIDDEDDISDSKFIELDEVNTPEEVKSIFYDANNEVVISNVEEFSNFSEFVMSVDREQRPILADLANRGFVKFVC